MTLLFLTMNRFGDGTEHGIYTDLMRKFRDEGHNVYVVFPLERSFRKATTLLETNGMHILGVRTLNLQKTNVIEKGLGQILMEYQFMRAIKKHFGNIKFDLITYSTPPITFTKVIEWAKKHNPEAKTYLMLKDIFPQNAVDLGMMVASPKPSPGGKGKGSLSSNSSPKGKESKGKDLIEYPIHFAKYLLYRSFRKKEEKLYAISDYIGCMSPANVKYVIEHNPSISPEKVEICPNSFAVQSDECIVHSEEVRKKYGLPTDKPIFFYGGNLGKPQCIPFLIECLDANKNREDCHFLVVGNGFDYPKIKNWYDTTQPKSVTVMQHLPKEDYDQLAASCDVGLIFLNYRFTIPNFPSRLLNCLMQKKPIIACTDPNCDTGTIAEENGFGMWCPSNNVEAFTESVNQMLKEDLKDMGEKGYQFFLQNYTVQHSYDAIMKHCM